MLLKCFLLTQTHNLCENGIDTACLRVKITYFLISCVHQCLRDKDQQM